MENEVILEEVIIGYRKTIYERYQYDKIIQSRDLPDTIDEATVNQLRSYFLDNIYPTYAKRTELNEAFKSLDGYIRHPKKLLKILFSTSKLIFKYGRHLPKMLNSGLNAMKTFKAATTFENNLVNEAIKNSIPPPYDTLKIKILLSYLSRKEIENFIEISQSLFKMLYDRTLIKNIIEIIEFLISVMNDNRDTYSEVEIKGLQIGLEMISEGDKLFNQLSRADQKNLIDLITEIEKDNLNEIF